MPTSTNSTVVLWRVMILMSLACEVIAQENVVVGDTLPAVELRGLNATSRNLSDFRGTPLVINIWASWCKPCRAEMKSLERLAWMDGGAFNVIGVSTDDRVDQALLLLKKTNATIPHFIDSEREIETLLGADRIPLTVFIDAQGRVLDKHFGAKQWDAAESRRHFPAGFLAPR